MQSVASRIAFFLIKIYQVFSRFLLPKTCRFYPSCSEYAAQAFNKLGFWSGLKRSFQRILRCSPFSKGGYDPVE